tara:strand:- start:200 stop:883 length:684 start_codon:yes stop_codon:yes gene_type:complete
MANFGWAYINCGDSGSADGAAYGPAGSIQYLSGSGNTTGSINLMYYNSNSNAGDFAAHTMVLTGTLVVSGTLSASHYHIKDIAEIDTTGSTRFGDSTDDVHIRTGSLYVGKANAASTLKVEGDQTYTTGFRGAYTAITATGQTSSVPNYIYGIGGNTNLTIRLHSASSARPGGVYVFKDESTGRTGAITITASEGSGDLIDGAPSYELSGTMPAISLYSNGTNWFVF